MIRNLKTFLIAVLLYLYDFKIFVSKSHLFCPAVNQKSAKSHIYRIAHALEKGMALPTPRAGYGKDKTLELIDFLTKYIDQYGIDRAVVVGYGTIKKLYDFHAEKEQLNESVKKEFDEFVEKFPNLKTVDFDDIGNKNVSLKEILAAAPSNPEEFFFSRHSVRQFSENSQVPEEILVRAVKIAQKSPSVCNRQCGRIHLYTDKEKIKRILALQDGNTGFGEDAGAVAVVTSDVTCFYKPSERNQAYVDGGLFAMSYVYALHAFSIGTCFLNWSSGRRTDIKMRKLLRLPENEVIITLLAIGQTDDEFIVAKSPRRDLDEVYKIDEELEPTKVA